MSMISLIQRAATNSGPVLPYKSEEYYRIARVVVEGFMTWNSPEEIKKAFDSDEANLITVLRNFEIWKCYKFDDASWFRKNYPNSESSDVKEGDLIEFAFNHPDYALVVIHKDDQHGTILSLIDPELLKEVKFP